MRNVKEEIMRNKIKQIIIMWLLLSAVLCFSEIRPVYAETTVVGRVTLPDGTPVPGASVSASFCSDGVCAAVPPVMSDEAGNFTLSLSDEFEWDIMASPPDNEAYTKYTSSESVKVIIPLSAERFVLDKPLVLRGFVKHISGTVTYRGAAISGISVYASGAGFGTAVSGTDGKFTMNLASGGTWKISVSQSEQEEWTVPEDQQVQFKEDVSEETKEVNIVLLPPDGYLKGRVLDPSGNPLPQEGTCKIYVEVFNTARMGWNRSGRPDADGNFTIPLIAGLYRTNIALLGCSEFSAPSQPNITIRKGTKDLGDIYLLTRNAVVKGTFTDSQGQAVADTSGGGCGIHYFVEIWSSDHGNFFNIKPDGIAYQMNLASGKYVVTPGVIYWSVSPDCLMPDPDYVFTGNTYEVELGENEEKEISLKLENVADRIIGTVTDTEGRKLTDVSGWAYSRIEGSPRHISKGYVSNGEFRLGLPEGTFLIGLELEPDSGYSLVREELHPETKADSDADAKKEFSHSSVRREMYPYEQRVEVKKKSDAKKEFSHSSVRSDRNITIILKKNDAAVRGNLKDASGQPVTGFSGDVFALPLEGISSRCKSRINAADGSYTISLAAGRYSLSYELETEDYISAPLLCPEITVSAGQSVSEDFILTRLSGLVMGRVVSPDDEPVPDIRVWARSIAPETGDTVYETSVLTDEKGEFSIPVPQNTETWVGTALDEMEIQTSGLRGESGSKKSKSSDSQKSDSSKRQMMILKLRDADTVLEGKVLMNGQPVRNAFVYAYSADGQKADGLTDSTGIYQLDIARVKTGENGSNSWTLKAVLKQTADGMCYRSDGIHADISDAADKVAVSDLTLKSAGGLPEPEMSEFKTEQGWTHILSDGTGIHIPENVTTGSLSLKAVIHPRTEGVPDDSENRCIGYGYFIEIYAGENILGTLDKPVAITLGYTDEALAKWGLEEEDIRPAYFLENSGWQAMDSFVIDKENNRIVFETDHLSVWSLVAKRFAEEAGDINGDRAAGLDDAVLCLRVCSGIPLSQPISKDADINGDGKIGLEEVIFLLQKLSR